MSRRNVPSPEALAIDHAYQQALAYHHSGRLQNAVQLYRQILTQNNDHPGALHMLGVVALSSGALTEAQSLIGRAAQLLPQDAGVHVNLALALAEGGKPQEALTQIDKALVLNPQMMAARINRVAILIKAGHHAQGLEAAQDLIDAGHDHPDLRVNQGIALVALHRPQEAIDCLEQILATTPQNLKALNNLGAALIATSQWKAAVAAADRALAVDPRYTEALLTKARALAAQGLIVDAQPLLQRAVDIQPANPRLRLELANCLLNLYLYQQAMGQAEEALAIDPHYAEAYVAGGCALAGLARHQDAIANYDKALELEPLLEEALKRKAESEIQLKLYADAIAHLEQAGADPLHVQIVRMSVCDWSRFDAQREWLYGEIGSSHNPFAILAMADDPRLHLEIARSALQRDGLVHNAAQHFGQRSEGRIRVGYFSADYFEHATTYLMVELFESHAHDRFEIHAFSYGPQTLDAMRNRVEHAVDHFHDVSNQTDAEIATLSRKLGIDIAVDLKGFTRHGRMGMFAQRCAPVQVSYLGYPGTTGADFMDYVIADRVVLPVQSQAFFTEAPVYMPHSYQVNDSRRAISERGFTRVELGLPDDGFVFCCFNNNYKIVPDMFDIWMRILQAVPGSVLWLFQDNLTVKENLVREAEQRGIPGSRLVFAQRLPLDEHLARHSAADLFIDTLPYNAHTTASDALWAGLPVLTLAGQAFAGRVAASLLTAVGMPELITHTPQQYEELAVHLATHPEELSALRSRLQGLRTQSPLFDGKRFTQDLEKAYQIMFDRQQAGLPSAVISVEN